MLHHVIKLQTINDLMLTFRDSWRKGSRGNITKTNSPKIMSERMLCFLRVFDLNKPIFRIGCMEIWFTNVQII